MAFVLTTCQPGAEGALKAEIAREWPQFRLAYSRPGFVTFKTDVEPAADFDLRSVFAHAYAISVGKATAGTEADRAREVARLATELGAKRLHLWEVEKEAEDAEHQEDEPTSERPLTTVEQALRAVRAAYHGFVPAQAKNGDLVLDVVLVSPEEWWIGSHVHTSGHRPWAGGRAPLVLPPGAPSRAYLKMEEGLEWSGLPLSRGDLALELGSAPGGASFALLERGLRVIGVDPGDMDRAVAKHAEFRHLRRQALQLKKEDVAGTHWIFSDMNVPPAEVLRAVEKKSEWLAGTLLGGLFTLKLANWSLAGDVPTMLEQLKAMGFSRVAAAHLYSNRREVCAAALTKRGEQALAGAAARGIFSEAR